MIFWWYLCKWSGVLMYYVEVLINEWYMMCCLQEVSKVVICCLDGVYLKLVGNMICFFICWD